MKKKKLIWAASVVFLFACASLFAIAKREPFGQDVLQKPIQYNVTVALKLIQAYVIDNKGEPVPGLKAEDFEITDDGQPVKITDLEYHSAVLPVPFVKPVTETPPPAAKLNRKFFLWFDFGFNDPSGIKRAKAVGLHFMDTQVRPEDEVALLSSSSITGIKVHEYLTGDHQRVRQAIDALNLRQIAGRLSEIELLTSREQEWARFVDPSGLPSDMGNGGSGVPDLETLKEVIGREGAVAQDVYRQMSLQFLQDFRALAKALRYIPGAKSLILFSGGIAQSLLFGSKSASTFDPYGTIEDQAKFNQSVITRYGDRDCQNEFRDLVQDLRASNTFIYAVNEIQQRGAEHDPISRDLQGDGFLRNLASETKGQYFHNTQDSNKAVEDIQKLTASYYVLGYRVSENWDGRYHAVKVSVKRKNVQCWGTAGYFNPVPFSQYTLGEKRLHLIDLALSESPQVQGIMNVSLEAIPVFGDTGLRLAVLGQLPHDPGLPKFGPKTEAYVLVLDEQGSVKGIKQADLAITPKDGDRIFLSGIIPLSSGRYKCRLVVRDLDSGQSARATVDVNASAPPLTGISASAPLWLVEDVWASWKDVFSKELLTSVYPFERGMYYPVLDEVRADGETIYGVLPISFYGVYQPEIYLAAHLVDTETGGRKVLPLVLIKKTESEHSETLFFKVTTGALSSGEHTLYLFVQDKSDFKKVFFTNFRVAGNRSFRAH